MKEKDPNKSKSKKVIRTVLATVLIVAGTSVTAFAAQGEDAVNKNVLMAEDVGNKALVQQQLSLQNQTAITGDIATEAQAVEIVKNALKGLFDVDVAEIKVEKPFTQFINVGDSIYDVPVWNIYWATAYQTKEYKLGDVIKAGEGAEPSYTCGALINAKTGDIIGIYGQTYDPSLESVNLSTDAAKEVVAEFMKSYNLVEGAVQDITLANDSYTKIFGFLVTMDNGEESSVRVSPNTGKVINWSNHNEFLDK